MERLISHSDYEDLIDLPSVSDIEFRIKSRNHRAFLKQPLSIEMFVPCDENGNVLDEPDFMSGNYDDNGYGDFDKYQYKKDLKEHQQAKENCLFEEFECKKEIFIHNTEHFFIELNGIKVFWNFNNKWELRKKFNTIEDLVKYKPKLTATALKQIGL